MSLLFLLFIVEWKMAVNVLFTMIQGLNMEHLSLFSISGPPKFCIMSFSPPYIILFHNHDNLKIRELDALFRVKADVLWHNVLVYF